MRIDFRPQPSRGDPTAALRPLRPDRERQRRRRRGQRRRRLGDDRHLDRPSDPRRLRHEHGDERRQPRLRAAGLRRARRRRSSQASSGFAGTAERRARPARRHARADHVNDAATSGNVVQTARVDARHERHGASRSRSASAPRRPRRSARPRARSQRPFDQALRRLPKRLAALRRRAEQAAAPSCPGLEPTARATQLEDEYYLSANVLKASEDKTFPGAIVAEPRLAVGPGGLRRRPGQHVLRLLPRGVRPRPLRGLDRAARRRRPRDRARRDAVPVRAPAAGRRLDAAQQPASTARPRPTRSARSSTRPPTRS